MDIQTKMISRGRSAFPEEWFVGYFCGTYCDTPFSKARKASYIIMLNGFWAEVDPATVGRFTGVTDKNKKMIFEGDIVKAYLHNETEFTEKITFRNGCFWFGNWNFIEFLDKFRDYEIIGNIFDAGVK